MLIFLLGKRKNKRKAGLWSLKGQFGPALCYAGYRLQIFMTVESMSLAEQPNLLLLASRALWKGYGCKNSVFISYKEYYVCIECA